MSILSIGSTNRVVRNVIHFKRKVIEELLRKIPLQFMKWTAIGDRCGQTDILMQWESSGWQQKREDKAEAPHSSLNWKFLGEYALEISILWTPPGNHGRNFIYSST